MSMAEKRDNNDTKLDVPDSEIVSDPKALKERLIDLKVNLVNVHKMPVYGHVILPESNKQKLNLWKQLHLPFLFNFRERRVKKYGG